MSDETPNIRFNFNGDMENVAYVGDTEYRFLTELLFSVQAIHMPENIVLLAQALNHFSHGNDFAVIEDIDDFNDKFRETYAAEEEKPFDQYNSSISDFAMPDLDQITPPEIDDAEITFYVVHKGLGIPYRVTGGKDGRGELRYAPL